MLVGVAGRWATRRQWATAPNALTISRLLTVPAMIVAAGAGRASLFLTLLAYALLTDAVDGRLARASGQASAFGAQLDSAADCALYLTLPCAVLWLFPSVRLHLLAAVIAVEIGYAVPILYGAAKYRRLTAYHTVGARLAAVLLSGAFVVVLTTGVSWPFYVATGVLLLSAAEEVLITRLLPTWQPNVPSAWHAARIPAAGRSFHPFPE